MIHKCLLDNFFSRSAVCSVRVRQSASSAGANFSGARRGSLIASRISMHLQGVPRTQSLSKCVHRFHLTASSSRWCGSQIRSCYDILRSAPNCWWCFLRMWSGDTISVLILSANSEADCSFKSTHSVRERGGVLLLAAGASELARDR